MIDAIFSTNIFPVCDSVDQRFLWFALQLNVQSDYFIHNYYISGFPEEMYK